MKITRGDFATVALSCALGNLWVGWSHHGVAMETAKYAADTTAHQLLALFLLWLFSGYEMKLKKKAAP